MHGEPPQSLVCLLEQLGLASAAQVRRVAPRVRRLAGELPDFETIWVDALQQARVLTPLQAAEINAGRGQSLRRGPCVIERRLASSHVATCFAARHIETDRVVRLYCVERPQTAPTSAVHALNRLIEQLAPLGGPAAAVIEEAAIDGEGVWAACPAVRGTTAAEWMAENGRLPAHVVLHIAREMVARLADLELLGLVHGDVCASGLVLQPSGHVVLPMPGLRGIVRPAEGYAFADLPPEAYDYLAPERIEEGSPPSLASDVYACGCLWWHLLTGRPPFSGGSTLAKLRAVHAARCVDVRQLALDVPAALARAIEQCLARDPTARPPSSIALIEMLGPPARGGHAILSRCLAGQAWLWQPASRPRKLRRAGRRRTLAAAGVIALLCAATVGLWAVRPRGDMADPLLAAGSKSREATAENTPRDEPRPAADEPPAARAAGDAQVDPMVKPAAAVEPLIPTGPDDLVLPTGRKVRMSELRFEPGQRIRGRSGKRPLISVTGNGLRVPCEDVHFEDVDFVWEMPPGQPSSKAAAQAMITVAAQTLTLRGCSLSADDDAPPIAIAWRGTNDELPGQAGELVFTDCVFRGVQAVVDCTLGTPLAVEMSNSLCVAAGPILRLDGAPTSGQTLALSLDHVTTRGDCAVLEYRYGRLEAEPGHVVIAVTDSALVTNPRGGLLILSGAQRPEPLLRCVSWSGQGSLVTPETAVAKWRSRPGHEQTLSDDSLEVAGLVRSEVEFAGEAGGSPAASRITRWQAPLRSADPPGANTDVLFLPEN